MDSREAISVLASLGGLDQNRGAVRRIGRQQLRDRAGSSTRKNVVLCRPGYTDARRRKRNFPSCDVSCGCTAPAPGTNGIIVIDAVVIVRDHVVVWRVWQVWRTGRRTGLQCGTTSADVARRTRHQRYLRASVEARCQPVRSCFCIYAPGETQRGGGRNCRGEHKNASQKSSVHAWPRNARHVAILRLGTAMRKPMRFGSSMRHCNSAMTLRRARSRAAQRDIGTCETRRCAAGLSPRAGGS